MAAEPITEAHVIQDAIDGIVASIDLALVVCDATGVNLPELISAALTVVAGRDGSWRLIQHRPGSWEAAHIAALDMSSLYPQDAA